MEATGRGIVEEDDPRHMMDHSPEQYGYIREGGRQQQQHQTNQRQKNAMTAAV